MPGNLDERMQQFRLASRELFNNFFRISDPYGNTERAWSQEAQFRNVEAVLFQGLVAQPMSLGTIEYGKLQPNILVMPRQNGTVPIMLNRNIDSGYWDYPIKEVVSGARLLFISFFDWDALDLRDNRYARIRVDQWPTHPEIVGKQGLIESQYVQFVKG